MALKWLAVVIAGCVALAFCIAAVLLRPMERDRRHLRPLANVGRLTGLPEYVRVVRLRTLTTLAALALLLVALAGAVIAGARPTGLPTATDEAESGQPEDIMLCVGAPPTDRTAAAALRFFAAEAQSFGSQRIGLTSQNRRVIPLTRDYSTVTARFSSIAGQEGGNGFTAPVSYVDYAEGVQDLIALCMTGFPSFDQKAAQRRSIVYVGPDEGRGADERRGDLFDTPRVERMAADAGIQVNALVTGGGNDNVCSLARATGGQCFDDDSDVTADLKQIRSHPPAPSNVAGDRAGFSLQESPDIPVLVALVAVAVLVVLPLVRSQ
jgi:hypothetical protein